MNQLKYHPKILLVEGKEDQRVIPELMEKNGINWGSRQNPIVYIVDSGGYEKLIEQDIIATELQRSGLEALGIIIDVDDHPQHRWQSLRNACLKSIPDLPEELPNLGLINITPNQIKLGIWMMPDNQMRGMLETFLAYLIPAEGNLLWEFAQEVAQKAKDEKGAPFKNTHADKANIYTWLAWQAPPGRQLHQAIQQSIFHAKHPKAQEFVAWFKQLYHLE